MTSPLTAVIVLIGILIVVHVAALRLPPYTPNLEDLNWRRITAEIWAEAARAISQSFDEMAETALLTARTMQTTTVSLAELAEVLRDIDEENH